MKVNYDINIKEYIDLLDDFHIIITKDIVDHITKLYPNDIAIRKYTRDLIKKKLGD